MIGPAAAVLSIRPERGWSRYQCFRAPRGPSSAQRRASDEAVGKLIERFYGHQNVSAILLDGLRLADVMRLMAN